VVNADYVAKLIKTDENHKKLHKRSYCSKLHFGCGVFQMDLIESAPLPSGIGQPIENDIVRPGSQYSLRIGVAVFVIGWVLSGA
jgi:hypothetical protein